MCKWVNEPCGKKVLWKLKYCAFTILEKVHKWLSRWWLFLDIFCQSTKELIGSLLQLSCWSAKNDCFSEGSICHSLKHLREASDRELHFAQVFRYNAESCIFGCLLARLTNKHMSGVMSGHESKLELWCKFTLLGSFVLANRREESKPVGLWVKPHQMTQEFLFVMKNG